MTSVLYVLTLQKLRLTFSHSFWSHIGFEVAGTEAKRPCWDILRLTGVPSKHYIPLLLLICWLLWKHRNDVVCRVLMPQEVEPNQSYVGTIRCIQNRSVIIYLIYQATGLRKTKEKE